MLNDNATIMIAQNSTHVDQGAICTDNFDDDATLSILTTGTVNTAIPETYTITYSCIDASGNPADPATRTVTVTDDTSPTLTLTGDNNIQLLLDTTYTELGATCNDTVDGNIPVVPGGDPVNTSIADTYTVTYDCRDAAGNDAIQLTRLVTIIIPDTTIPVVVSAQTDDIASISLDLL